MVKGSHLLNTNPGKLQIDPAADSKPTETSPLQALHAGIKELVDLNGDW